MPYAFKPMTADYARAIADWHYPPPYTFYDWTEDPDDLAELLDPRSWPDRYFAVVGDGDDPVGFFGFTLDGDVLDFGLGLRPDLTGRGLGLGFLEAGLAFARARYAPSVFQLSVATFNARAIRVYERAGFRPVCTYMHHTNGDDYEFLRMSRAAAT